MKKIFLTLTFTLLFIPFGISQDLPSYVPTDGLVAYYPFNGNANDESGNGNHGTVNGATLTEDRFGNVEQAYTFDGINDFIDISNISGLISSQGISLSIWTKNYNPTSSSNQQFLFLIGSNPNARILMRDESNQVSGSILNCNCSDDLYTSHEINPNQWTNIVLTYNLEIGEQKLYVNGVNVDSKTESMNTYYTTNNIAKRIGSYGFNNHYFNGVLDDASIWNRTLTEQEIQNLYNSSTGDILLNGVVSAENNQIKNVADPTDAQDAVTKNYTYSKTEVDALIANLQQQINEMNQTITSSELEGNWNVKELYYINPDTNEITSTFPTPECSKPYQYYEFLQNNGLSKTGIGTNWATQQCTSSPYPETQVQYTISIVDDYTYISWPRDEVSNNEWQVLERVSADAIIVRYWRDGEISLYNNEVYGLKLVKEARIE